MWRPGRIVYVSMQSSLSVAPTVDHGRCGPRERRRELRRNIVTSAFPRPLTPPASVGAAQTSSATATITNATAATSMRTDRAWTERAWGEG